MKEPKYMKFDNNNSDKLEFFGKSLGPERKEEKRIINQSSQKKKKLPFSMPSDLDKKPVPNTQNEDFIPFFAKRFITSWTSVSFFTRIATSSNVSICILFDIHFISSSLVLHFFIIGSYMLITRNGGSHIKLRLQ